MVEYAISLSPCPSLKGLFDHQGARDRGRRGGRARRLPSPDSRALYRADQVFCAGFVLMARTTVSGSRNCCSIRPMKDGKTTFAAIIATLCVLAEALISSPLKT